MNRSNSMLFAFLIIFGPLPASAQEVSLKVADGSSSGTYKAAFDTLKAACGDSLNLTEAGGSGALENLGKLTDNDANAGFMHEDVILWKGEGNSDYDNLKTLLALWPEDVHFVARSAPFLVKKGYGFGVGKEERTLISINDLAGLTVGAAGGGYVTANMIKKRGDARYVVAPQFGSGHDVMEALNSGSIAAAVFVGAAPLPNLKDLGAEYRILSIPEDVRDRLKGFGYRQSAVSYTKMSAGNVTTVSVQALLVVQNYTTPKWAGALRAFHQCFVEHLGEIRETPGMHKAWKKVTANAVSKWPMYEIQAEELERYEAPRQPQQAVPPKKKPPQKI